MVDIDLQEDDLRQVVHAFYAKVRADSELGPVFNGAIGDWFGHLEKLCAFWSSVMLTTGRYKGQPMAEHLRHPEAMTTSAFARWLRLWDETTDAMLAPEQASALQDKAARIAKSLAFGIRFQRRWP
ncbi:group III truncated hemoglobin [Sphingomonas beigongshangi]|uniref:group III truncated hemoglobin n=1 Tax=Sphingomonas beigongshangi TaxID=2782540 RepID=UPI001AEE6044